MSVNKEEFEFKGKLYTYIESGGYYRYEDAEGVLISEHREPAEASAKFLRLIEENMV